MACWTGGCLSSVSAGAEAHRLLTAETSKGSLHHPVHILHNTYAHAAEPSACRCLIRRALPCAAASSPATTQASQSGHPNSPALPAAPAAPVPCTTRLVHRAYTGRAAAAADVDIKDLPAWLPACAAGWSCGTCMVPEQCRSARSSVSSSGTTSSVRHPSVFLDIRMSPKMWSPAAPGASTLGWSRAVSGADEQLTCECAQHISLM